MSRQSPYGSKRSPDNKPKSGIGRTNALRSDSCGRASKRTACNMSWCALASTTTTLAPHPAQAASRSALANSEISRPVNISCPRALRNMHGWRCELQLWMPKLCAEDAQPALDMATNTRTQTAWETRSRRTLAHGVVKKSTPSRLFRGTRREPRLRCSSTKLKAPLATSATLGIRSSRACSSQAQPLSACASPAGCTQ